MRLIDADALRRKLVWGKVRLGTVYEADVRVVTVDALKSAPTVDAKPVVHGRWVKPPRHKTHCKCSNCGRFPIRGMPNYCPNCGAKMDLEE